MLCYLVYKQSTTLQLLNYDLFVLACEVSAKRLFPNFSFFLCDFRRILK